jgi:hypothetical protein
MTLIEHIEVGSGGAASIEFTSIPSTYTDLLIVTSIRSDATPGVVWQGMNIGFNDYASAPSRRNLYGTGSGTGSDISTAFHWFEVSANATASTFGNGQIYIPNYTSSTNKSFSIDGVSENNGTAALQAIVAGLWSVTNAITSIKLTPSSGNIVQYSSASLFGILAGSDGTTTVS